MSRIIRMAKLSAEERLLLSLDDTELAFLERLFDGRSVPESQERYLRSRWQAFPDLFEEELSRLHAEQLGQWRTHATRSDEFAAVPASAASATISATKYANKVIL